MFKSKLKTRVESLEEYFGLAYSQYGGYDSPEHLTREYGVMKQLNDLKKQVETLLEVKKNK